MKFEWDLTISMFDFPRANLEDSNIGDVFEWVRSGVSKSATGIVIAKDNLNKIFFKLQLDGYKDCFVIWKYRPNNLVLIDHEPKVFYSSSNEEDASEKWDEIKDNRTPEEIEKAFHKKWDNFMKPNEKYVAPSDVMDKWAIYNEKHK